MKKGKLWKEKIILVAILIIIGSIYIYKDINNRRGILLKDNIKNTVLENETVAVNIISEDGKTYNIADDIPTSGYQLNKEKSVCKVATETSGIENAPVDNSITIEYVDGKVNFIGLGKRSTRCYLYFDKETGINVIAKVNNNATSSFPASSSYTPNSLVCTNDATAKFNYNEWVVEVDSVDDTTCTVNFTENINQPLNTYLKNKVCSNISFEYKTKDCLVNEKGYRYEGSNPNNYILFNDELWRIIGVFTVQTSSGAQEDLVKLIRYNTLDGLAWDGSNSNDWSNAALQKSLNNGYLNGVDETCNFDSSNTKTCSFSKTGIKAGAREKIESVVWNIGGASSNLITTTTEAMYTAERGSVGANNSTTNITWTGKVGLMYPSDYGYASLAATCARTTNLYFYDKSACAGKNWLKKNSYEWTITPRSSDSTNVFSVTSAGNEGYDRARDGYGASPSIYLKSSIQIKGGAGTYDLPYILN